MTRPVYSKLIWCLRVVASALVLWAIYRHLLRPDWSVRITVGTQAFDTYQRFWLWESPDASEHGGVLGGIRWGRSLLSLAGNIWLAYIGWRLPVDIGSVVRQIDGELFASAFLARVTLARMSLALAVQMNGLGSRLCCSM